MDITSFLLGYESGKTAGGGSDNLEVLNDLLDEINGEVIGETLYTVTFVGADGSTLGYMQAYEGDDCDEPVAAGAFPAPTKEGTKYYGYRFAGWSFAPDSVADENALKNVQSNLTLYAAFTEYEIFIASGDCGHQGVNADAERKKSIQWRINPDYVLSFVLNDAYTVTSIASYFDADHADGSVPPWYDYRELITSVIIGDGITTTGMYCFKACTSITNVVFPTTMRSIHKGTFEKCTGLTSIVIPASIRYIYQDAFYGCTALASVTFEKTNGWGIYAANSFPYELVETIVETELTDVANAASRLVNTAHNHDWHNPDA